MNGLESRLEDYMTEGDRINELHESLLKLTSPSYRWAVSTLIFELVSIVESRCEAMRDLEPFGIKSNQDALVAYVQMRQGNHLQSMESME